MPAKASTYAIPRSWRDRWGIRRYGFHGLSHARASRRAGELLGRPAEQLRLVTAHLGAGGSLAAVAFGRSVDTTMGFTPLEGLVMATRSGSVDPGLILWVQHHGGLSVDEVQAALEHESGLLGLSEASGDLRRVIAAMGAGDPAARLAYEVYVYRIQTSVAAMCAAMGGIDGLVFTGGAGEATPLLRADTCAGLAFLQIASGRSEQLFRGRRPPDIGRRSCTGRPCRPCPRGSRDRPPRSDGAPIGQCGSCGSDHGAAEPSSGVQRSTAVAHLVSLQMRT